MDIVRVQIKILPRHNGTLPSYKTLQRLIYLDKPTYIYIATCRYHTSDVGRSLIESILPTYLRIYLPTYLPTYVSTHQRIYLPSYLPTFVSTYLPTYLVGNIFFISLEQYYLCVRYLVKLSYFIKLFSYKTTYLYLHSSFYSYLRAWYKYYNEQLFPKLPWCIHTCSQK